MRLTIVGLGVVGTSLGLALREVSSEIAVTGHDPDPSRAEQARKLGAVHNTHWNLISACDDADLIIMDMAYEETEKTLVALGGALRQGAVVLDTGALKAPVMDLAAKHLPPGVEFIGGHPVSPALSLGHPEPSADLLKGVPFYLVVPQDASQRAVEMAVDLVTAVGAEPRFIGALEHDGLIAATAQLPFLATLAILTALEASPGQRDREGFLGGELLAQVFVLTGAQADQTADLIQNRDALLGWIDACLGRIEDIRGLLVNQDAEALKELQSTARKAAEALISGEEQEHGTAGERENFIRTLWLGSLGRQRGSRG